MKSKLFTLCAAALAIGVTACNNDGKNSGTGDSMTMDSPATSMNSTPSSMPTTSTSEGNYNAMYDTLEMYSAQGRYLNPKTGKAYKSLKVDRTTGNITDDMNQPVSRYVDNTNWWVYSDNNMDDDMMSWDHVGDAKMEGDKLMYKGDGDAWVDYDTRWKKDDESWIKKHKISDDGRKEKIVTQDGDKIKTKVDEDGGMKIKVNDQKIKTDKDGNIKKG